MRTCISGPSHATIDRGVAPIYPPSPTSTRQAAAVSTHARCLPASRARYDRLEPSPVQRAHANADVVSPHGRNLTDLRPHGNHQSMTER